MLKSNKKLKELKTSNSELHFDESVSSSKVKNKTHVYYKKFNKNLPKRSSRMPKPNSISQSVSRERILTDGIKSVKCKSDKDFSFVNGLIKFS